MIGDGAILALGFVNPALLGGSGLIALPILIHLLSRRRHQRISWAATRFLLEAEKKNRRRMRIEQWLLIALRCLAMLLLTLLLARPFIQPGLAAALLGGRDQTRRIVVLDDSASLAHRSGPRLDFDTLRETARRLFERLHDGAPGDSLTVYLTSEPDEPLIEQQRLSAALLEDLETRLAKLEPVNAPADPRAVIQAAARRSTGADLGDKTDLYILSDFQRSDWQADEAASFSPFEPLVELGSEAVRVILIALNEGVRDNFALLEADFERPHALAGLPAVLRVKIANYSSRTLSDAQVTVEADGAPAPPTLLAPLASGEVKTVSVEVALPDAGYAELLVGLDAGDGFSLDDHRRLSASVAPSLRVLLVDGQPSADPVLDEVFYLKSALTPTGPFRSGISVEVVDPGVLAILRLEQFDSVMLCNVAAPGPSVVTALAQYARGGGGVVFFLGDEIRDREEYNRVFFADGAGILPAPLGELIRRQAPDGGAGAVRRGDHPVTAMFSSGGEALSEQVHFHSYYRCKAAGDAKTPTGDAGEATVLAHYDDEARSPLLLERTFGRGRVLLFTTSADLDWSDWPRAADGSYVVTMLEAAQYVARESLHERHFLAGETLSIALAPEEYEAAAVFRAPPGSEEPTFEARARGSDAMLDEPIVLEGPVAKTLGVYTVEATRRDGQVETRPLSVNLNPRESDLQAAGARELAASLGNVSHKYIEASQAFLTDPEKAQTELWPALLVALLVTLMAEQILAWWFGTAGHVEQRRPSLARLISYVRRRLSASSRAFPGGGKP